MKDWKWYAGSNEEEFHSGPFDTREQAVLALDDESGYVIEAYKANINLAGYFDPILFLEQAEDSCLDLVGDSEPLFDVSPTHIADLKLRVQAAITAWQQENNLVFIPWSFGGSRNLEWISNGVDV